MVRILISLLFVSTLLSAQTKKTNVLFILADDLGINALNCYGNDIVETPNIDKLFSRGMHFTNGYSNDPTCAPSRAAIMTGQLPPRTNIYRVVDRFVIAKNANEMRQNMRYLPPASNHLYSGNNGLSPDKLNIAKVFKNNGYNTAAYGKWHLGTGTSAMHNMGFDDAIEAKKNHYNFKTTPEQSDYDSRVYNADYCTEKGIAFMKKSMAEEKPFFLYMPYYLVHAPFEPKEEYVTYFKSKLHGTEYDHKKVIDVIAMIKSLDDSVGDLLDALEELGIDDNTLVVFTSDNGHYKVRENNMFALPYRGNKGNVWEGGIRVPYIFKWNKHIEPGSQSAQPIVHVDLFPTFTDLLDLKVNEEHDLDGMSLKRTLLGKKEKERELPLVWFYTNYGGFNAKIKEFTSKWVNVIQLGDYKLLEDIETNTYELYDLSNDPTETTNILLDKPNVAERLKGQLKSAKIRTGLPEPIENPEYSKN